MERKSGIYIFIIRPIIYRFEEHNFVFRVLVFIT